MAATLKFDKLHKLTPYRDFFGKMYISPEEMNERIKLAEEIEDVMFYIFAYWIIAEDAGLTLDDLKHDAVLKLTSVFAHYAPIDPYLEQHIEKVVNEVVDTTQRNAKKKEEDSDEEDDIEKLLDESDESLEGLEEKSSSDDGKDYWTSQDRAMLISENEANAFYNYIDYREAKKQGKTKKTWLTELDDKVRLTHTLVEGKTVDIDGLFLVGDSLMRFPMDVMYDAPPEETVNCRCVCRYE